MEVTLMPMTHCCPHCKNALTLLENQINTNVSCPTCRKWFLISSSTTNELPSQGDRKLTEFQRVTGSTQFLFGLCAAAGLFIAGIIGFFIWQDMEKGRNPQFSDKAPIAKPVSPNPPEPPDAKKISDAEISANKTEESAPNPDLKHPAAELEKLPSEDQSEKAEAKANNPE
jgi:uncharacterized protein YbaR (Trm112 family)